MVNRVSLCAALLLVAFILVACQPGAQQLSAAATQAVQTFVVEQTISAPTATQTLPPTITPTVTQTPTPSDTPTPTPTPEPVNFPVGACMRLEVPPDANVSYPWEFKECVDSVAVMHDGSMQLNFSWTYTKLGIGSLKDGYCLAKGSDYQNKNMYIVDDLGNRYDHTDGGGYPGLWVPILCDDEITDTITDVFLFPPVHPEASHMVFHDDDQGIETDAFFIVWGPDGSPKPGDLVSYRTPTPGPSLRVSLETYKTLTTNDWVWDLRWSPDSKSLAVSRYMEGLEIWDIQSGNRWPPRWGRSADWSWDGSKLAIVQGMTDIVVYDGRAAEPLLTIPAQNIIDIDWSPTWNFIAACGTDSFVSFWNAEDGTFLTSLEYKDQNPDGVVYSPDGKYLAADFSDIVLWNVQTEEIDHTLPMANAPVWAPDSQRIAFETRGGVEVYDLETGLYSLRLPANLTGAMGPRLIDWSPDGRIIAASTRSTISLWDAETGKSLGVWDGDGAELYGIQFSPDGHYLAVGSKNGAILILSVVYQP